MTFYDRANTRIRNKYLVIKDKAIDISNSIKYLGLIIDHKWSFSPHFEAISTKVDRMLGYLCNIMLNTRGADEGRRKLYVNVIFFIRLPEDWLSALAGHTKRSPECPLYLSLV
jgi:hypothetical protein